MAKEKMGGSKCRQRGSRKDQCGLNFRRKAGLPAKSGKRGGKWAIKSFPDGKGRYSMAHSNKYGYPADMGYTLNPKWSTGEPVWVKVS